MNYSFERREDYLYKIILIESRTNLLLDGSPWHYRSNPRFDATYVSLSQSILSVVCVSKTKDNIKISEPSSLG
jgi:hypothetical protein